MPPSSGFVIFFYGLNGLSGGPRHDGKRGIHFLIVHLDILLFGDHVKQQDALYPLFRQRLVLFAELARRRRFSGPFPVAPSASPAARPWTAVPAPPCPGGTSKE